MCIYIPRDLILNKKSGVESFANIMELRSRACEQWISADLFCGLLREVGNLQTMLICARRAAKKKLQKGIIGLARGAGAGYKRRVH